MIVIDDIIISDDLKDKFFVCDLNACKGGCCVQGDDGAPLEKEEEDFLHNHFEKIKPYLTPEGIAVIESQRNSSGDKQFGKTPLINGGACAYVQYDNGVAKCGIENAFNDGAISFRKPISCHLYPVRISKFQGFDAVNYEQWDICNAACSLGDTLKIPLYKFLKEALIRKYGDEFYKKLEGAVSFSEQGK